MLSHGYLSILVCILNVFSLVFCCLFSVRWLYARTITPCRAQWKCHDVLGGWWRRLLPAKTEQVIRFVSNSFPAVCDLISSRFRNPAAVWRQRRPCSLRARRRCSDCVKSQPTHNNKQLFTCCPIVDQYCRNVYVIWKTRAGQLPDWVQDYIERAIGNHSSFELRHWLSAWLSAFALARSVAYTAAELSVEHSLFSNFFSSVSTGACRTLQFTGMWRRFVYFLLAFFWQNVAEFLLQLNYNSETER